MFRSLSYSRLFSCTCHRWACRGREKKNNFLHSKLLNVTRVYFGGAPQANTNPTTIPEAEVYPASTYNRRGLSIFSAVLPDWSHLRYRTSLHWRKKPHISTKIFSSSSLCSQLSLFLLFSLGCYSKHINWKAIWHRTVIETELLPCTETTKISKQSQVRWIPR